MSDVPRLYVTNGLATGNVLGRLDLMSAKIVRQLDNNDSLNVRVRANFPVTVRQRTPLRFVRANGQQREFRVRHMVYDATGEYCDIEGAPPWAEISTAGIISQVVGGDIVYSFGAILYASEWLTNFFVPNLSAQRLGWISNTLGIIERDRLIELNFARWNKTQLVQALAKELEAEPYLSQSAPGAQYQLNLPSKRGSTLPTFSVSQTRNVLKQSREQADTDVYSGVHPFGTGGTGDEPGSIGDNAWLAQIVATGWVSLFDPAGGANAIAFDHQFKDGYLEIPNGFGFSYEQILESRMSDGAVQLASTALLTNGRVIVRVVKDASGTPYEEIENPAALAYFDRAVQPIDVPDARGERNWVPNATFNQGVVGWTPGNGGWVEAHLVTETTDLVGAQNGTKTPGSPLQLNVDGLPPFSVIRRGSLLQTTGTALCTAPSHSTINSLGNVHLALSVGLAFSVSDGDLLTMAYVTDDGTPRTASAIVDGNQTAGNGALNLRGFPGSFDGAGNGVGARQFKNGDKMQFIIGGTYYSLSSAPFVINNLTASPIVQTVSVPLFGFYDAALLPHSTNLAIGDAVVIRATNNGETYSAVVHSTYTYGDASISLDITVPAYTSRGFDSQFGWRIQLEANVGSVIEVTNTAADAEWQEDGTTPLTWTGGLANDRSGSRPLWIDGATGEAISFLNIIGGSGATAGSTSCTISWPFRPRIATGAVFSNGGIGAEYLFVNETATMDASGAGVVKLLAANTKTIADNTPIVFYRNTYGWPKDGKGRAVMRVMKGATSSDFLVPIRGASPRSVQFKMLAQLFVPIANAQTGTSPTPVLFEVIDANSGALLGSVLSQVTPPVQSDGRPAPQVFNARVALTFDYSRLIRLRISSAPVDVQSAPLIGLYVSAVSAFVSPDPDVPFVDGSHANVPWHAANRALSQFDLLDPALAITLVDFSRFINARQGEAPPELGQNVYFRALGVTQRVVRIETDEFFDQLSQLNVGRIERTASKLLAGVN